MEGVTGGVGPERTGREFQAPWDSSSPGSRASKDGHRKGKTPHPQCSLQPCSQQSDTETAQVSVDRGMDRDVARKTTECHAAVKADGTMLFAATRTDLETVTLSAVSQRKRMVYM